MKTYILGHKKPDLDSVVGSLALSNLLSCAPAIIDTPNPETVFVFEKFAQKIPELISATQITPADKIILVDHNEPDQRLDNLNPDQIIGIYDHHKAKIELTNPIEIIIKPFGSSNTLIYTLYKQANITPPANIATLMLCAILSDTVGLKSSTATTTDKDAVKDLSQIAKISDLDSLTLEIFKAKSNITSLSDEQIVKNDYKIFDFGRKVFIGQIETVEQNELISKRKANLLTAMGSVKQSEKVDLLFLAVTDILKVNTKILLLDSEEKGIGEKAFGTTANNQILDIGPKMSRKKDIAPAIEKIITVSN